MVETKKDIRTKYNTMFILYFFGGVVRTNYTVDTKITKLTASSGSSGVTGPPPHSISAPSVLAVSR